MGESTKQGPANHHAGADLDAPTPPGGPQRQDAADGPFAPGGPFTPAQPGTPKPPEGSEPTPQPDPDIHPSSPPDGPGTIPSPDNPEPEPAPRATDEHPVQRENAETAQDQPSDGSGGE